MASWNWMKRLSALLALCAGKLGVTDGFPWQRTSHADFHISLMLGWRSRWANVEWPMIWNDMTLMWRLSKAHKLHKQFGVYLWCYVTYQHLTCILDLSIKQVCPGWGGYHDNHYHWKHGHTHDDVHVNIENPKAAQHRHDTPTGGKRWKRVLITSWNETS